MFIDFHCLLNMFIEPFFVLKYFYRNIFPVLAHVGTLQSLYTVFHNMPRFFYFFHSDFDVIPKIRHIYGKMKNHSRYFRYLPIS